MIFDLDQLPDEYGLPPTVLGVHEERFYGAVGRLICLTSLLERRLVRLVQLTRRATQYDCLDLPTSQLLSELREQPDVDLFGEFLTDTAAMFELRNHLAHDAWPAHADGEVYGWRSARQPKKSPQNPAPMPREDVSKQMTLDELVSEVPRAVGLLWAANQHIQRIQGDIVRNG